MNIALIVAAGKGIRMQSPMAKQYMPLAGVPILSRTLLVFDHCPMIDAICLVISPADRQYCQHKIIDPIQLSTDLTIADGGDSRQESVYSGLAAMHSGDHWVAIHDGVRPFVTSAQIEACLKAAQASGACILGMPAVDTLKEVDPRGTIRRTEQRKRIWLAQTPQVFKLSDILNAHINARKAAYHATDDAALMERIGRPVRVLAGSRYNIKITTDDDLILAEAIAAAGLNKDQ